MSDASPASAAATLTVVDDTGDVRIRVIAGATWELSLLLATHGCTAEVELAFTDDHSDPIRSTHRHVPAGVIGGTEAEGYRSLTLREVVPQGARWARLGLRKGPTLPPARDSYLFVAQVSFDRVDASPFDAAERPELDAAVAGWGDPRVLVLPLPQGSDDGCPHQLHVQDQATGQQMKGSPLQLGRRQPLEGGIDRFDGAVLIGWVRAATGAVDARQIALEIDGAEVARIWAWETRADGALALQAPLPAGTFDDRTHALRIRAVREGTVIHEAPTRLPRLPAPWETPAAAKLTASSGSASATASHRYRSLQIDLEKLASGDRVDPVRTE